MKDEESDIFEYINKNKLYNLPFKNIRHEQYSGEIVKNILKEKGLQKRLTNQAAEILSIHHQGKNGDGKYDLYDDVKAFWESLHNEIHSQMSHLFFIDFSALSSWTTFTSAEAVVITGIIILSDWIASNTNYVINEDLPIENYLSQSRKKAKELIDKIGLNLMRALPFANSFQQLFWYMDENLRPVQQVTQNICANSQDVPKFCIMEAPMGEGKTETAIYMAMRMMNVFNKHGLYIALPTSATSNLMHQRMTELFGKHNMPEIKLLHSRAWLDKKRIGSFKNEDQDEIKRWLSPMRRAMLSSYGVGTIDQAMLSVMKVKYGVLRMVGLTNKVLIIDEIHAYDIYMREIIKTLISYCGALDIPVILLSATLPLHWKKELIESYENKPLPFGENEDEKAITSYPLISCLTDNLNFYKVSNTYIKRNISLSLFNKLHDWQWLAEILTEKIQDGGCIVVILNTVDDAQSAYAIIKDALPKDVWHGLLHARFKSKDRGQKEELCLNLFGKNSKNRPSKAILVATQVVEQSLDLDFDMMITAIAPVDLILQRAGRLHRHSRQRPISREKPELWVLAPQKDEYGKSKYVYYPSILNRSLKLLKDKEIIVIPDDIPKLVEDVYCQEFVSNNQQEFEDFLKMKFDEEMSSSQAQSVVFPPPLEKASKFLRQMTGSFLFNEEGEHSNYWTAKTRQDNSSQMVSFLPPEKIEIINKMEDYNKDLIEEVFNNSVNLRDSHNIFKDYCTAKGALRYTALLPQINGISSIMKDHKEIIYTIDNEYGIKIKR